MPGVLNLELICLFRQLVAEQNTQKNDTEPTSVSTAPPPQQASPPALLAPRATAGGGGGGAGRGGGAGGGSVIDPAELTTCCWLDAAQEACVCYTPAYLASTYSYISSVLINLHI